MNTLQRKLDRLYKDYEFAEENGWKQLMKYIDERIKRTEQKIIGLSPTFI